MHNQLMATETTKTILEAKKQINLGEFCWDENYNPIQSDLNGNAKYKIYIRRVLKLTTVTSSSLEGTSHQENDTAALELVLFEDGKEKNVSRISDYTTLEVSNTLFDIICNLLKKSKPSFFDNLSLVWDSSCEFIGFDLNDHPVCQEAFYQLKIQNKQAVFFEKKEKDWQQFEKLKLSKSIVEQILSYPRIPNHRFLMYKNEIQNSKKDNLYPLLIDKLKEKFNYSKNETRFAKQAQA